MQRTKTFPSWTTKTVVAVLCAMGVSVASAGPREQAKRIHDRLTGVPPSAAVLDSMAAKIAGNDALGAAYDAMDNPAFLNTKVRELATPWTNREQSVYVDMNDMVATVVGLIRDDAPFDQVLYDDVVYVGTAAATAVPYSQSNNDHYLDLQLNRVDLSDPANLERQAQSAQQPGAPFGVAETAGVMTTRGFSEAYLVAGTNRAGRAFRDAELHVHGSGGSSRHHGTRRSRSQRRDALAGWRQPDFPE